MGLDRTLGVRGEFERMQVQAQADIYAAVGWGRTLAGQLGFEAADVTRVETIIAELARNVLRHAGGGTLTLRCVQRDGSSHGQRGLEITVEDRGPGIADLAQVLAGGHSTGGGLGQGLSAVRRLADEFAVDSVLGRGTWVRACKWLKDDVSCDGRPG